MTEILILAAIALFVLSRLYVALGRNDGDTPAPVRTRRSAESADTGNVSELPTAQRRPVFTGPAAGGLEDIYNADETFNTRDFTSGAKAAYKMIVDAFARGDREALRPLLDDDVYEAWDNAIAQREADGVAPFDLLRLKKSEIEDASLEDGIARVSVRYEAELSDTERTKSAKEIWTFKRTIASNDPNWVLDDVETAV